MLPFLCMLLGLGLQAPQPVSVAVSRPVEPAALSVPFSTGSAEARTALQQGVVQWENHRMGEAVEDYRKATKADPNFAVAHLFLSTLTPDPEEQSTALRKAVALRSAAAPDEQLLIDWLAYTSQNKILPAITAMNELLGRYPRDKHLLYRTAIWFRNQRQLNRAVPLYERLLQLDPQFADALNQLGYIYAFQGESEKAMATIKRYVAVLPNEPNPEDSYAEICRMGGRYDEALAHYRRALKIEPSYWSSQEGIAATYSLIGDQARARAEYAVAIEHAPSPASQLLWTMNSAVTWVREKDYAKAGALYRDVARRAHDNNLAELESGAYRNMSLYEKDPVVRQQLLNQAEAALHHSHPLSILVSEQQTALVERARIYAEIDAGHTEAAGRILERLSAIAGRTHNGFIQVAFHGAAGAVLTAQGKYEDAIGELLEDDRNPYSLRFLIFACQKTGATAEAGRWSARLNDVKNPTLEQLLATTSAWSGQPQLREASKAECISSQCLWEKAEW
jgi:tetratricopeptide (TPR) repeat protein